VLDVEFLRIEVNRPRRRATERTCYAEAGGANMTPFELMASGLVVFALTIVLAVPPRAMAGRHFNMSGRK
jgi:hypothetical protein